MNKQENPVPSLYQLLAEIVGAESIEYEQICSIINNVKNGVETNNEQPRECCLKEKLYNKNVTCGCTGHFCSQNGEQVNSIFS